MTTRGIKLGAGLAAALMITSAGAANAHHCYKSWSEAAYQHHLAGGTAWVPLSTMGEMYIIPPELQADCGWTADAAVRDFMAARGMEQEPLIHSKATTGSGAYYKKGKEPGPFNYLGEEDFNELGVRLGGYLDKCVADLED